MHEETGPVRAPPGQGLTAACTRRAGRAPSAKTETRLQRTARPCQASPTHQENPGATAQLVHSNRNNGYCKSTFKTVTKEKQTSHHHHLSCLLLLLTNTLTRAS